MSFNIRDQAEYRKEKKAEQETTPLRHITERKGGTPQPIIIGKFRTTNDDLRTPSRSV